MLPLGEVNPTVSAAAILRGDFDPRLLRGKDVVIGTDSEAVGDQYFVPGFGKMGGAYVQVLGADGHARDASPPRRRTRADGAPKRTSGRRDPGAHHVLGRRGSGG